MAKFIKKHFGWVLLLLGGVSWAIMWIRNIEYIADKAKDSKTWEMIVELMGISQLWLSPALIVAGIFIIGILYVKRHPTVAVSESEIRPQEQGNQTAPPQINVTINIDGTRTFTIEPTQSEYDPAMKSFIKFTMNGTLAILDSHNIAGVTDNGARDITVTFDHALDRDDFTCTAAGTGTVEFKIAEKSKDFARIVFGEPLPDIVHLTFE